MLRANRTKIGVLVTGSVVFFLVTGIYLLRTQQTHAQDWRSRVVPPTAFASELSGQPVLGVFEGITPCSNAHRPLPQIPENTNCEQMIWKLTLSQDPATGSPTTYILKSFYGIPQQGTPGLQGGGTPLNLEGKWTIIYGAKANPDAVVYQLNPDNPQETINFIKMDDNLLHVLAPDKSLMVGNGAWSYTLNRTDRKLVSNPSATATHQSSQTTPPPVPDGSSSPGIFDGRIPCIDSVLTLLKISPDGCQLVKLRLTLYQNSETRAPTTYQLYSVYVGKGDTRYSSTGTWATFRGTKIDSKAIVYQLNPDGVQQPIFLLKADDNHLFFLDSDLSLMVGDALKSFTLSRADQGVVR